MRREKGEREVKNGEEEEKRERRVGSNTARGTRRREVLLSGRGPLSSLSRWWQVSVAALAAEDGRHRRRQGTFSRRRFSLNRLSCARGEVTAGRRVPSTRARRVCPPAAAGDPRTMCYATPGVTPPPRSDATATRYAPRTRCWERAREPFPFRS
jgi:hypothetical protein